MAMGLAAAINAKFAAIVTALRIAAGFTEGSRRCAPASAFPNVTQ